MSLKVTKVFKNFGDPPTEVLKNISFEIKDGDFVSLTGKSGSGKSTLLYIISSLDYPSSGTVEISGSVISEMQPREMHRFRNLHMGFVFQSYYLLPELSALENVLMPARKSNRLIERKRYAVELLNQFGLIESKHKNLPGQLSGGEQQRVSIARALIMEPSYIFADEPTGNLDTANGNIVMDILSRINKTKKTTIVYVTHDSDYAGMAKRQISLSDGKII